MTLALVTVEALCWGQLSIFSDLFPLYTVGWTSCLIKVPSESHMDQYIR